jgi:hypothetical protein
MQPVQPDYSDVYNVMAFFMGDPERGEGSNESLAEQISEHASHFIRAHWRWEDMQAYVSPLMCNYKICCYTYCSHVDVSVNAGVCAFA